MDRVVEQQLVWIRRGAVDSVQRVFQATIAAVTGADQVLADGKAELLWRVDAFLKQQGHVQGNDLRTDLPQLPHQLLIEDTAQLRQWPLLCSTAECWRQTQVGQQPDHDVARSPLLQRVGAGGQAVGCSCGAGRGGDQPLKEVVTATGQVVERVRVGSQPPGKITGTLTQNGAGPGVTRGDDGQ
ncbi:hypothetical protein D3C84_537710 [compost metagenome]